MKWHCSIAARGARRQQGAVQLSAWHGEERGHAQAGSACVKVCEA
jgi:hypothetical protein